MRVLKISMALIPLLFVVLVPATVSARGSSGHGKAAAPKVTSTGKKSGGSAPKTTSPKATATKTTTTKTTGPKAPKAGLRDAKVSPSASKKTTTTTHTAKSSTGVPNPTIDFTATPLGQKLARNDAIRSKLETRLLALGYTGTVYQAAYGFKNQGQLMASVNNAQNLGIPFEQLKLQMTGYTVAADGTLLRANLNPDGTISLLDPRLVTNPAPTKSLGQAKQTLRAAESVPSGSR
jgi:hypothetical protein